MKKSYKAESYRADLSLALITLMNSGNFWSVLFCLTYLNQISKLRKAASGLKIKYKKDGYRQQNVRQRQKLISIIDYNVCILEYLQQFWRYSPSKNGLALKSGY